MYIKGQGFYLLKYMKVQGNLSFWSVSKKPKWDNRCIFMAVKFKIVCLQQ